MDDRGRLADERRARWWSGQRNEFGLPDALYAPLPVAVLVVIALGAGSAFAGLFPGANTHDATLDSVAAPWIGLLVLSGVGTLWYWFALRHAYGQGWMGLMLAAAVALSVGVSVLSVKVLAEDFPDPFIGGLGIFWLLGGLLLLMGFLFDGFVLSLLMGAFMGAFLGVMASFMIGTAALLIMVAIYLPVGALAGGTAGVLKPLFKARWRR